MGHLWVQGDSGWEIAELDGEDVLLTGNPTNPLRRRRGPRERGAGVIVRRARQGNGREVWALFCEEESQVRVNGVRVSAGMRVLRDRDEIEVPGAERLYFSTERRARVEEFPGRPGQGGIPCPRCKLPMEGGTPAVQCPGCGVWHHESAELGCWTYSDFCAVCDQKTAFEAGFRWTPEEL